MASQYAPPKVSGVVSGILNLYETPEPVVTVKYDPIDEPHTVSVTWEIRDALFWTYCCELQQREAGAKASLSFIPLRRYSNELSTNRRVRVRYSIAINGEAPTYSDALEFEVQGPPGEPPRAFEVISVRETVAQWFEQSGTFIQYVDLNTNAIGEFATVYAKWPNMANSPRWLTWDKPQSPGVIWQSEPQVAEDGLGIFQIPKKELLRLNEDVGVLHVVDEDSTSQSLYVAINITLDDPEKRKVLSLTASED